MTKEHGKNKVFIPRAKDTIAEMKSRHSFDPALGRPVVKLFSGDWYVSTNPEEMLVTILGSCVAACLRDPYARVGGMNHFLLPSTDQSQDITSNATRYGTYAMETLINDILKAGGRKDRLEAKVFGGGNVTNNSAKIGSKNAAFIRAFLKDEKIPVLAEDLEGNLPRRVHYTPGDGKVMMRRLHRVDDLQVVEEEKKYQRSLVAKPVEGEIDLF